MLNLFAAKDLAVGQAIGNQSRQLGGFAESLAVAPEAQPSNAQNLLRSWIRAGYYPRRVDHQQARGHIAGDFFAEALGSSGAFLLNAMQPLQFLLLIAELLDDALHGS